MLFVINSLILVFNLPDYAHLSANSSDFRISVVPVWTAGIQSTGMYPATGVQSFEFASVQPGPRHISVWNRFA